VIPIALFVYAFVDPIVADYFLLGAKRIVWIKIALMAEQADDHTQEFMGDGAQYRARTFAFLSDSLGKGFQKRVVAFGDQGGHVESLAHHRFSEEIATR
jgi:hypothetical protein